MLDVGVRLVRERVADSRRRGAVVESKAVGGVRLCSVSRTNDSPRHRAELVCGERRRGAQSNGHRARASARSAAERCLVSMAKVV